MMSKKVCNKFINFLDVDSNQREIVIFGIKKFLSVFINLITMLLISILLGKMIWGFFFLVLFIPIKIYAGGYHAKTWLRCFVFSNVLYGAVLLFKFVLKERGILALLLVVGIIILSPVDNVKKRLDNSQKRRYRLIVSSILLLESTLLFVALKTGLNDLASLIVSVWGVVFLLQILGRIKNYLL